MLLGDNYSLHSFREADTIFLAPGMDTEHSPAQSGHSVSLATVMDLRRTYDMRQTSKIHTWTFAGAIGKKVPSAKLVKVVRSRLVLPPSRKGQFKN